MHRRSQKKYRKGQYYYDANGVRRKVIAEAAITPTRGVSCAGTTTVTAMRMADPARIGDTSRC